MSTSADQARSDAVLYGVGYVVNGERVHPASVTVYRPATPPAAASEVVRVVQSDEDAFQDWYCGCANVILSDEEGDSLRDAFARYRAAIAAETEAAAIKRAAGLCDALKRYGRHDTNTAGIPGGGCQGVWPFQKHPCSCGLAAALVLASVSPAQPKVELTNLCADDDHIGILIRAAEDAEVAASLQRGAIADGLIDVTDVAEWSEKQARTFRAVAARLAAPTATHEAEVLREAVRAVLGRCEALADEALDDMADAETEHEKGFLRGQKRTAKSISAQLQGVDRSALDSAEVK